MNDLYQEAFEELPMEFAVGAQKFPGVNFEGSIG